MKLQFLLAPTTPARVPGFLRLTHGGTDRYLCAASCCWEPQARIVGSIVLHAIGSDGTNTACIHLLLQRSRVTAQRIGGGCAGDPLLARQNAQQAAGGNNQGHCMSGRASGCCGGAQAGLGDATHATDRAFSRLQAVEQTTHIWLAIHTMLVLDTGPTMQNRDHSHIKRATHFLLVLARAESTPREMHQPDTKRWLHGRPTSRVGLQTAYMEPESKKPGYRKPG